MTGLTLTQARQQVLDHIDDELGQRYAVNAAGAADFTKIDVALGNALSRCLSDYATAGGDNFTEEVSTTTSATDGTASLASQGPVDIKDVRIQSGTASFWKVPGLRRRDIEMLDTVQRNIVVAFVREYVLPTVAGQPLVGIGATSANTWLGFDGWVCAKAALQINIKDDELRQSLAALEADARGSVLGRVRLPRSKDWPMPRRMRSSPYDNVHWTYLKTTSTLQLVRCTS